MNTIEDTDATYDVSTSCTDIFDDIEGYRAKITYENFSGIACQKVVWIDPATNNCYRDDSASTIRTKCLMIFFANPIFVAAKVVWQILRIPVQIGWVFHNCATNFWQNRNIYNLGHNLFALVVGIPYEFFSGLANIIKSGVCAWAIAALAVIGLFLPFFSRVQIAKVEEFWHNTTNTHDIRHPSHHESCKEYIKKSFWDKNSDRAVFIAYCFQPVKNLDQDQITHLDRLLSFRSVSLLGEIPISRFSGSPLRLNRA